MKKLFENILQRFDSADARTRALRTLRLKTGANHNDITRSYRSLIARYHPDRGGDTEAFIHIRQAYELLR